MAGQGTPFDPSSHSHRRFNPLKQEWVLCSPHRTKRPWQGAVESAELSSRPEYDPKCYLCPGNERAGGKMTDKYEGTFIFENDFAALVEDSILPIPSHAEDEEEKDESLFRTQPARGKCYVICFSPRHDLTVAEMSDEEIVRVVEAWTKLYVDVSKEHSWLKYIQIFENKGSMMGCSNPHPHGQAWSMDYIPTIPATMLKSQYEFAYSHKPRSDVPTLANGLPSLLLSYVTDELKTIGKDDSRIVIKNEHFVALVPFWASWPFEMMILPFRRHIPHLEALTDAERDDLAKTIGECGRRMDNLFECSFGYSMGVYQAPVFTPPKDSRLPTDTDREDWQEFAQLHFGFYPPLLRSRSVKKFLVGFELFAETQRDITPEQAAKRLRDVDGVTHYKVKLQNEGAADKTA